jgi:hypothetical protein
MSVEIELKRSGRKKVFLIRVFLIEEIRSFLRARIMERWLI